MEETIKDQLSCIGDVLSEVTSVQWSCCAVVEPESCYSGGCGSDEQRDWGKDGGIPQQSGHWPGDLTINSTWHRGIYIHFILLRKDTILGCSLEMYRMCTRFSLL